MAMIIQIDDGVFGDMNGPLVYWGPAVKAQKLAQPEARYTFTVRLIEKALTAQAAA